MVDTVSNMVLLEKFYVIKDRTVNKWVTGAATDCTFEKLKISLDISGEVST